MTQTYSPGVMALLDDPTTCPTDLLLFFHNKRWLDLVVPHNDTNGSNGSKVTVFNRIRDHHAAALEGKINFQLRYICFYYFHSTNDYILLYCFCSTIG